MPGRIYTHIYHAIWYTGATIILVAAVSVTLIRLGLPHINEYRKDILEFISQHSGYTISAKKIDASWQGWTPRMNLYEVTVTDKTGTDNLVTLDSANVSVNPLSSLILRELSPLRITVYGPELVIKRSKNGSFQFIDDKKTGFSKSSNAFTNWLLQQQSVSVENATINYLDENLEESPLILSNVRINFKQAFDRTQIGISANLPEKYGQSLNLLLDAYGDITTPNWTGQVFVEGNNILPGTILSMDHELSSTFQISSAPSGIRLWSNWERGQLNRIDGIIDATDISIVHNNNTYGIEHITTSFSGKTNNNHGIDAGVIINNLSTPNGIWPKTAITISSQTDINGELQYQAFSDYVKIEDIYPPLQSLLINDSTSHTENFAVKGNLKNVMFTYNPDSSNPVYLKGDIDVLTVENQDNIIARQRGGHIEGNNKNGFIRLESSSIELFLAEYFERNMAFHELNGDVTWEKDHDNLVFSTNLVDTHTANFNLIFKGNVIFSSLYKLPQIDLLASIHDFNLENTIHYLPLSLHEKARAWIKNALVSGDVPRIDIALRGALDDFPFSYNQGQFKLIAGIQNAILDYDKNWIPMDKLDADLEIDNTRLAVYAYKGYIYNAEVTSTQAVIEDLIDGDSSVKISGKASGNTNDALFIIDNSPLSESNLLGQIKNNEINGALSLDLNMDIPLHHKPMSLNGDLTFTETRFHSTQLGISLDKISGNILFTRDSISSNNLTAEYFENTVELGINTDSEANLVLSLTGYADVDFITNQLKYYFPNLGDTAINLGNYLQGTCRWTARLMPATSVGSETDTNNKLLKIESNLSGLVLDLPAPLGKKYEPEFLEISTMISKNPQKEIGFKYSDHLAGNIKLLKNETFNLHKVELALGQDEMLTGIDDGIRIHGHTDYFSFSEWINFFNKLDKGPKNSPGADIYIDLFTSVLAYQKHEFANTSVKLTNKNNDWNINLGGDDIEGSINLDSDNTQRMVKANLAKLHLNKNENDNETMHIDPRTLPSIELTAEEFTYGTYELGQFVLNTDHIINGLNINKISFDKPELSISGYGAWEYINDQEYSSFSLDLYANKLDVMLSTFDYGVTPVKNGETNLKINAEWKGSPMDFSLSEVNGDLSMNIEKGQVLDIEPAAGRLFGLLSLQTLPRRLSLDFSDLFSKGFSFDQISGSFTLEDGNAYTNNLSMIGPSANINITGRTGLVVKDYDQVVTVTPQVSNSLPVTSALFGPIGIGVGAVIFLAGEVFESIPRQIDKLLRYQYTISGSWDNPVIEKFKNKIDPNG